MLVVMVLFPDMIGGGGESVRIRLYFWVGLDDSMTLWKKWAARLSGGGDKPASTGDSDGLGKEGVGVVTSHEEWDRDGPSCGVPSQAGPGSG